VRVVRAGKTDAATARGLDNKRHSEKTHREGRKGQTRLTLSSNSGATMCIATKRREAPSAVQRKGESAIQPRRLGERKEDKLQLSFSHFRSGPKKRGDQDDEFSKGKGSGTTASPRKEEEKGGNKETRANYRLCACRG